MALKKVSDFGITMKEAEERTKQLTREVDPTMEGEKAEPQDESDITCYYFTGENHQSDCPGPMGDERSYVIKNGKLVMAHRRCHKRDQDGEKKTPNIIIR